MADMTAVKPIIEIKYDIDKKKLEETTTSVVYKERGNLEHLAKMYQQQIDMLTSKLKTVQEQLALFPKE